MKKLIILICLLPLLAVAQTTEKVKIDFTKDSIFVYKSNQSIFKEDTVNLSLEYLTVKDSCFEQGLTKSYIVYYPNDYLEIHYVGIVDYEKWTYHHISTNVKAALNTIANPIQ